MQERSYWNNSIQYFRECIQFPGGFLSWAGSYLTQYFYHPTIGIALLIGVWIATYALGKVTQKPRCDGSFLLLISAAALLCSIVQLDCWVYYLKCYDYCFYHSLGILAAVILSMTLPAPKGKGHLVAYAQILLIAVLGYWPLGIYAFVAAGIVAMRLLREDWKKGLGALALALVAWGIVPIIETSTCTMLRPDERWLFGLQKFEVATLRQYSMEWPLWIAIIIAMLPLSQPFPHREEMESHLKSKDYNIAYSLGRVGAKLLLLLCSYFIADHLECKDVSFHSELKMQRAVQEQRWDDVLQEFRTARTSPTREMMLFRDIALMNKGELFTRYQYNNQSMGPVIQSDSILVRLCDQAGDLIYYNYGETNFGIRRNIERTMHYGYSFYAMKVLAECALVNGEYDVARKYADIMSRSTFQSEWAEDFRTYLKDTTLIAESPRFRLVKKMHRLGSSMLGTDDNYVEQTLINKLAHWPCFDPEMQDIALMYCLQEKDINCFWSQLMQFMTLSPGRPLPRCIQEAAVFYSLQLMAGPDPATLPIDQEVMKGYQEFMNDIQTYVKQGVQAEQMGRMLRTRHGNTYFWDYCTLTEITSN